MAKYTEAFAQLQAEWFKILFPMQNAWNLLLLQF